MLRLFNKNYTSAKSANGFLIKNDIAAVLSSPLHCSRSGRDWQNALYYNLFNNVVFISLMYLLIFVDVKIGWFVKNPTPNCPAISYSSVQKSSWHLSSSILFILYFNIFFIETNIPWIVDRGPVMYMIC